MSCGDLRNTMPMCKVIKKIIKNRVRDIELIVINDGSTDGSLSALERIATGDDRPYYKIKGFK